VSRNADYQATGGELVGSLDEALKSLSEFDRVFVIGGEQLFKQAFDKADRLYITEIDLDIEGGDTFFEVPNASDWKEVERTPGSEGDITFSFITLERK
jgi:dihydrofolate reductase